MTPDRWLSFRRMPGRAAARYCPIKSYSMMRSIRLSISRVMWCWSTAVWRKWRGWRGVTSTLPRYANSISAHGCRLSGWSRTKRPAFSTPPGQPVNRKASSATLVATRSRWRPRWTPFSAAKRAACSSARRISAGWLGIPISCMPRCWRGWRRWFTKGCQRIRTAAYGGKLLRSIRSAGCSRPRPPSAC